jgi:capsular exopolysaccharide synthesis family protein
LHIFGRRKGTLTLFILLSFLASVLFTIQQTPSYEARESIEIQSLNENFLNMKNVSPTVNEGGPTAPGYDVEVQTQAKLLQSESLLDRVATKLDLEKRMFPEQVSGRSSSWRTVFSLSNTTQVPTREQILSLVANNLKVSIDPNTRLAEIRYDSSDPELAADFLNTLTAEFIQQNRESRSKAGQQTGEWLTQQTVDVRVKLKNSEDELQKYARASGLLFTSENNNVAEEKLHQLQTELSKAQEDRVLSQSKYELASKASPETLPEVLDDATRKDYELRLTDLRRQLADLSSSLTPAHPAVKKVQAQIAALQQAIEQEHTNVVQRLQNEYESALRREHLLAASYAIQTTVVSDQAGKMTQYNILKNEVDTDRQLYDSMLQNVQTASMTSALGASSIRIVDPAVPPQRPYRPIFILNAALGLFAGAFIGIAFVIIQERADRTIRGPGDASVYLDVQELGAILSVQAAEKQLFPYYRTSIVEKKTDAPLQVELVTSTQAHSVLADSFRAIVTSILSSGDGTDRPRLIVVTSAGPEEGKTTVASNLALALSEINGTGQTQSVLLIDGDLRRPRLHTIFAVPNRWGLGDLLEGKAPPDGFEEIVLKTGFRNLFLLPSGSASATPPGLLQSPGALQFLNRMRTRFHTVIIDTPPMLYVPDARILGRLADGVVLVVRSARTMREAALAAKDRLANDGTRVLGTILNRWDPQGTDDQTGGYASQYHYHHSEGK